jgi:hypothetical protein
MRKRRGRQKRSNAMIRGQQSWSFDCAVVVTRSVMYRLAEGRDKAVAGQRFRKAVFIARG